MMRFGLNNNTLGHFQAKHVAVSLRLETDICEPHQCQCGALVDAKALH